MLPGAIWKEMLEFSYDNSDDVTIWRFPQKSIDFNGIDKTHWTIDAMSFINKLKRLK